MRIWHSQTFKRCHIYVLWEGISSVPTMRKTVQREIVITNLKILADTVAEKGRRRQGMGREYILGWKLCKVQILARIRN